MALESNLSPIETNTDGAIRSGASLCLLWRLPQSAVLLNLLDPKAKYVCFHFCGNTYQPSITQMNQGGFVAVGVVSCPTLPCTGWEGEPNACPLHSF